MSSPRNRFQFDPPEIVLLALGVLVCAWTLERQAFTLCIECAFATVLVVSAILITARFAASSSGLTADRWERARVFVSLPFLLWFYGSALGRLVPVLGAPLRDATMLSIDRTLFGETPSVPAIALASPLAVEVLSACYLSLHAMMACLLIWAFMGDAARVRRICQPSYLAFAVGFFGYIAMPCVGPEHAFPALFTAALPVGPISAVNNSVISAGTALYDVFPSLHTGMALTILIHDARAFRRRFYFLLLPCTGIIISTIVLRYHYAIDLIFGAILAITVSAWPIGARRPAESDERVPEAQAA